ncbi:hypothetical protein AB1Y20_002778 [Prymnesium parvum]|uniref:Uncharacterized protein n=1 Tax=Prymnesium parvum TaxID=97485 RepID=A0AB34JBK7_PRYPA
MAQAGGLQSLLVCPPGSYRSADGGAAHDAEHALRRHWKRLHALGYRPRSTSPAAARRAAARGFVTYESPLWPRPAYCERRHGIRTIVDEPPGTCEPNGAVCDKYRISREYKFVWRHAFKAGVSSLSPYLSCNMLAMPAAGLLRQLPAPIPGYLHVGSARDPLLRFISAFQEVYFRLRLRPTGPCPHFNVTWLHRAISVASGAGRGCASAKDALHHTALRPVLEQESAPRLFVADVECGIRFPEAEHVLSQSLFLGGNTSVPQPLDMLLRIESLPSDLLRMKQRIGYLQDDKCPLQKKRVASQKPRGVPGRGLILRLLAQDSALLQSVCNIYMQDYLCLGYALPEGCQVAPELHAVERG